MLGISKEEKEEPSMLESAARELERLNALSPNAKEFIPRSTNVQSNTIDSKPFDAFPKFLTPKAALPTQQRTLPPYAMFPPQQQGQHPQIRPVPMFPVPRHIPFNPQIPVVPVTLVGVRNMPPQPPPPMNIMPQTSQVGPLIQTTNMMHRPSTLMPPPGLVPISSPTRNMLHHPMSSPSPPILPYASAFPSPTAQQLASEAQQYATIAAQQMTKKVQTQSKESSPSPPERSLDLCSQKVKDKIMSGVRVFIILRGLPGSGKSTLARELKENGEIFSADDYFMNGDVYCYDQRKLTDAHDHCRRRALEAVRKNVSPVIIDNTNTQVWEMCPYVDIAKSVTPEYEIEILEPSTPWRKSDHAVPYESIKRMLDRYQRNVTVDMLINTKSRSRPVTILPQNNIKETETKTAKKSSAETKNNSSSYNVDDNEDIWQDVGSFKWKNYYQPLMNEQEEEKDENEDLKDEEFPALKSNDKRKSQVENKSSKHTERKDKKRPETKENISQEDDAGSKNGNAVMVDNSNVTDRIDEHAVASTGSMSSEKLVKNNMLPFSTGLGFQMNKHKGLSTANLQKQIELISAKKLLPENMLHLSRTSRTPSFEKGRSEDKEFSDEIHELVDSLMSEHVEDKTISDLSKVQDELKAYLHIMPIDEQQRQDAECLIDQKLRTFQPVEQNDNKENEKVHQDTNLPNMSSATDIVDGRFNIESSFPSELNNVEDNQNQTISVTDEDQTIGSIELKFEKVFDVIDEKPERESENLNDSEGVDLNVNKSGKVVENEIWSTDQLKGQGHDENWDNNGKTEQADEAQGSFNQKELEMKHIEKEYWDSKSSVNGTNSSLQYGLNSKNNPVKLEDKSENQIDAVTEQLNDLSDDCLGEKFWDVDSDGEKDTEKKYWKNEKPSEEKDQQVKSSNNSDSQVKSSNESDTQPKSFDKSDSLLKTSNKLDTENKIESTDSKFEKESSPNVWEEPKTKRQRKRNNRDKNKQKDNVNSNENEVLNEAIQSKQNNEPESEISSKASVKNNEDQQTDLSSKAAVKSRKSAKN
ncbi:N4BP2 [Mytilus edulis]|uniref:N4BP2 n=1 Tax=Mytilus edulis TaxID=6550 RepID=A0A8S3PW97_MYTED|nr:N4BP2 [Mytilus edulis]